MSASPAGSDFHRPFTRGADDSPGIFRRPDPISTARGKSMLDVLMIALTAGFFGLAALYVLGCERL